MDDDTLKRALAGAKPPPPDEAAKRRTLNLAVAAFEDEWQKSGKSIQGLSWFGRLRNRFNSTKRRRPMNRMLAYGGMATAMVTVLTVGWTMYQTPEVRRFADQQVARLDQPADHIEEREFEVSEAFRKRDGNELPAEGKVAADGSRPESNVAPATPGSTALPDTSSDALTRFGSRQASGLISRGQQAAPAPLASKAERMIAPLPDQDVQPPGVYQDVGRDRFEDFETNPVKVVDEEPVSTFSIDVDTASYSFVRRQLNHGLLPQKDAVRVEEMINYFDYAYPLPETRETPFRASVAVTPSPWAEGRKLVHIGIKGYDIAPDERPRSNLVFLLDVSGSMNHPDKLPLLKNSMKMLLESLQPDDTVGIVVYAGAAGKVLEPTPAKDKAKILEALDRLAAGGSTAGAEGIRQAYQLAEANFDTGAVNRVILASDGDFNVDITSTEELKDFVERKRKSGIYLSVLGFGQGNLNDQLMQALAQNGNGTAAHIDTLNEARKVLVEEATGTLFPIAKDVKIQVEFNPATVAEYRLIGYETRALKREDFRNDKVDAGELGRGSHGHGNLRDHAGRRTAPDGRQPLRTGPSSSRENRLR